MIQGLAITTVWTFDRQRTKAFFTQPQPFTGSPAHRLACVGPGSIG
ncbi:hypothetical protein [Streptomyces sp. NPDC001975]